jgi:hypothetical protein
MVMRRYGKSTIDNKKERTSMETAMAYLVEQLVELDTGLLHAPSVRGVNHVYLVGTVVTEKVRRTPR